MTKINCSGAEREKRIVIEPGGSGLQIAGSCAGTVTSRFVKSILDELNARDEKAKEQYNTHIISLDSIKAVSIKYHLMNPSLFELAASKVAHYLFPENFAEYKFLITPNMNIHKVDAGYFPLSASLSLQCDQEQMEGVENVYAAAFFLGLDIRSYQYIKSAGKTYLYIDDFSYPFHRIDAEQKVLTEEYRGHKVSPSDKDTLFPTSLYNTKCGEWIDKPCNSEKLKNAYEKIMSVPQEKIREIVDTAITVLQSIECQDGQDESCMSYDHYQQMQHYADVLDSNYLVLSSIMQSYEQSNSDLL